MPDYHVDTLVPEDATCHEWMGAYEHDCGLPATHRVVFEAGALDPEEVILLKCDRHSRRFIHSEKGATNDVQPSVQA